MNTYSSPLIQLKNVFYCVNDALKKQLCILDSINLTLHEKEIISIKGPSGSGKSTLLYIMSGLLRASQGSVFFKHQPLDKLSLAQKQAHFRQNIAFIFQDFQLLEDFSVYENLLLALSFNKRLSQLQKKQIILDHLIQLGLENRCNHLPSQLSGGEQQRIATLRAILKPATCIFCDEPTGNLDDKNAQKVQDLLLMANKTYHKTIVTVSHQDSLHQLAHTQYTLKNKKLISL